MLKKFPSYMDNIEKAAMPLKLYFESTGHSTIEEPSNPVNYLPQELKDLYSKLKAILKDNVSV
jgi:hypothetical protein